MNIDEAREEAINAAQAQATIGTLEDCIQCAIEDYERGLKKLGFVIALAPAPSTGDDASRSAASNVAPAKAEDGARSWPEKIGAASGPVFVELCRCLVFIPIFLFFLLVSHAVFHVQSITPEHKVCFIQWAGFVGLSAIGMLWPFRLMDKK